MNRIEIRLSGFGGQGIILAGYILGVKNNELCRITPRENMEVNDTWICDKGRFAHAFVDHSDRLTVPLIRRNGYLQPATWDEALDLMAERFRDVRHRHGADAFAALSSARCTNEDNWAMQKFVRAVMRTNNLDHCART